MSVVRVPRIEGGGLSTRDVLDQYVSAPGGTPVVVAGVGDK
ncbi:hypothetical protein [Nocardiopsis flavescens]